MNTFSSALASGILVAAFWTHTLYASLSPIKATVKRCEAAKPFRCVVQVNADEFSQKLSNAGQAKPLELQIDGKITFIVKDTSAKIIKPGVELTLSGTFNRSDYQWVLAGKNLKGELAFHKSPAPQTITQENAPQKKLVKKSRPVARNQKNTRRKAQPQSVNQSAVSQLSRSREAETPKVADQSRGGFVEIAVP